MLQAPTTLFDRMDEPTVTVAAPPALLFDATPLWALSAMTSCSRSALTLPGPLIPMTPLPALRLMELSVMAALTVPPPVPSRRTPPPLLLSMRERSIDTWAIALPCGLLNTQTY